MSAVPDPSDGGGLIWWNNQMISALFQPGWRLLKASADLIIIQTIFSLQKCGACGLEASDTEPTGMNQERGLLLIPVGGRGDRCQGRAEDLRLCLSMAGSSLQTNHKSIVLVSWGCNWRQNPSSADLWASPGAQLSAPMTSGSEEKH